VIVIDAAHPELGGNVHGGDKNTWCPALWSALIREFNIKTMMDVGCGEGHAVKWFRDAGVEACGFDGLSLNVQRSVTQISHFDLTTGELVVPVDLVWCCEVVEHIPELYLDNLLGTLASGRVIAMTHAIPHQLGHNHVNCQNREYWIERIVERGYQHNEDVSRHWRKVSRDGLDGRYFGMTGHVFWR